MQDGSSSSENVISNQLITFEFPADTHFPLQGAQDRIMWKKRGGKIIATFERDVLELCFRLAEHLKLDLV